MIYLKYFKSILINNPVKIFYILLIIIPFYLFMKEKDIYVDKKRYVIYEFEKDNSFNYLVYNIKDDNVATRYSIKEYDTKKDTSKGYYIEKERRLIYYFELVSIILSSILFLITHLIILFEDEDKFKWTTDNNGNHIKRDIYKNLIKCELDNGIYYYTINKRLIYQSNSDVKDYKLFNNLESFIKNENLYPIFETKGEKRKNLLNKILK